MTAAEQRLMVGITVRLTASTLNTARALAEQRGVQVTALIRQWVDQNPAEQTDVSHDDPVVARSVTWQ